MTNPLDSSRSSREKRRRILAILASRPGPMTANGVAAALIALEHPASYGETRQNLGALVRRGHVETRCDTIGGTTSRIFWPTPLGLAQAQIDADQQKLL
jgi:hypothetical protein